MFHLLFHPACLLGGASRGGRKQSVFIAGLLVLTLHKIKALTYPLQTPSEPIFQARGTAQALFRPEPTEAVQPVGVETTRE